MQHEWLMAGFGGQGILFLGDLLAQAGMMQGLQSSYMPTYGVAMRGGTANCVVRLSDESIGSPLFDEPTAAIIMNQQSFDKFQARIRPGGLIVANSSIIKEESFRRQDELRVVWTPATELARDAVGTERAANMTALGAFLAAEPLIRVEVIEEILNAEKNPSKRAMAEKNMKAMRAGMASASSATV